MYDQLKRVGWTYYTTENSELAGDRIIDLAIDHQGCVWAVSERGLNILRPEGGWTIYTAENSGWVNGIVRALAVDAQGRIWAITDRGLSIIRPEGEWITYSATNSALADSLMTALAFDAQNRAWVVTIDSLNVLAPYGGWTTYTAENSGLAKGIVTALAVDARGRVWVGILLRGVSVLAPDGVWTNYTAENSGLDTEWVNALVVDVQGRVWAGTDSGLWVLSPDGLWTRYDEANSSLTSDNIKSLVIDSQGQLWIGAEKRLSVLAPDGNLTNYTPYNSGLPPRFHGITNDAQGRIWMIKDGIVVFNQAASIPPSVVLGVLVLTTLSLAAFIIQVSYTIALKWMGKTYSKLDPSENGVAVPAPELPEKGRHRIWLKITASFLCWYLVYGLIWLFITRQEGFLLAGIIVLLCTWLFNLILVVGFAIKPRTRPFVLGILAALALNMVISVTLAIHNYVFFFIPFFINP